MNLFKIVSLTIPLFIAFFAGTAFAVENGGYSNPRALVSVAQLKEMIADNSVKIIDARSNARFYLSRIPGAVNIPVSYLDGVREGGILVKSPDAEKIAALMSSRGVSNDDFVVIYDEAGGSHSARIAWMLMHFGHTSVALLDGGWDAWEGETDEGAAPPITPSAFTARDDGNLMASTADVKAVLGNPEYVILDTRALSEFTGERIMSGATRGGHIPGAILIDWVYNMDAQRILFLKSAEELKAMYEAKGVTPDKTIIVYCHASYRSALSAFVLKELLGYPNVLHYEGSWLEWSNTDAPIAGN